MPDPHNDALLVFPTPFPVKVMGKAHPEFAPAMLTLVRKHAPDLVAESVETRGSRAGRYVSLTFTINATSREQLDALYRDLSEHPMVSMAL